MSFMMLNDVTNLCTALSSEKRLRDGTRNMLVSLYETACHNKDLKHVFSHFLHLRVLTIFNTPTKGFERSIQYYSRAFNMLSELRIMGNVISRKCRRWNEHLRQLIGLKKLELCNVTFSEICLTTLLQSCPSLTSLNLDNCMYFNDDIFRNVVMNMKSLKHLTISRNMFISVVDMPCLPLSLQTVKLGRNPQLVNVISSPSKFGVHNVLDCDISMTPISSQHLAAILNSCPKLLKLTATQCHCLYEAEIHSRSLQHLNLKNCEQLSSLIIECDALIDINVSLCNQLKVFYVHSNSLSRVDLTLLRKLHSIEFCCPILEFLDLSGCMHMSSVSARGELESPAQSASDTFHIQQSKNISSDDTETTATLEGLFLHFPNFDKEYFALHCISDSSLFQYQGFILALTCCLKGKEDDNDRESSLELRSSGIIDCIYFEDRVRDDNLNVSNKYDKTTTRRRRAKDRRGSV